MTTEQKQAYEWAKSQSYQSVAARYAKELCGVIDDLQTENAEKGKEIEQLTKKATLNAFIKYAMKRACEELVDTEAALARVEAERDAAMKALEDMRFAYINKDADVPHRFETEALACAERLLEQWRGAQEEG